MTPDRKKPTAGFWITVALVVALPAYPLSFGPACWLTDRGLVPQIATHKVYHPLAFVFARCGTNWICNAMTDYGLWGSNRRSGCGMMILVERLQVLNGDSHFVGRESF